MKKIIILIEAIIGELIKIYIRLFPFRIKDGLNKSKREHRIIVSLTSYGRRVSSVLPFTLFSLLRQETKPDDIIVWLDSDNWNKENIPDRLKKMMDSGVEVRFYRDIKSYKKIIPALESYPDALIITADDDLYYKKTMVGDLYERYLDDPSRLYVHRAHRPTFDEQGRLKLYNDWEDNVSESSESPLFPTTGGGCLYRSDMLYKDVCNSELFMELSPKADDVWLYFMIVLARTPITVLRSSGFGIYISLDIFYQYFHSNSSLSESNRKESMNDVQISNVMTKYSLKASDLIY